MPRTLPTELEAVNNGQYQAVFRVDVYNFTGTTLQRSYNNIVAGFIIENMQITLITSVPLGTPNTAKIRLRRGAVISGTEYLIGTSKYFIINSVSDSGTGLTTTELSLIPRTRISFTADEDYQSVLGTFCGQCGLTSSFENPTADYWSYQFFPDGKQLLLNDARKFIPLLRQKYLITATDIENNKIHFSALRAEDIDTSITNADFEEAPVYNYAKWASGNFKAQTIFKNNSVRFMWRDETGAINYSGDEDDPLFNLGYLESTDSPPDINNQPIKITFYDNQVDLRIITGDTIAAYEFEGDDSSYSGKFPVSVKEVFDRNHSPSWRMDLTSIDPFQNTEGGQLPSTIERISNYTPLNTSLFDGVLSATDNNLQAAMDTLDDHDHGLDDHIADTSDAHDASAISLADSGSFTAQNNVEDYLQEIGGNLSFPFLIYTYAQPYTVDTNSHIWVVGKSGVTFLEFIGAFLVDTANSGSNYWTITAYRITDFSAICSVNTQGMTSSFTWTRLSTSSFSIASLGTSDIGAVLSVVKTGSPGGLYVGGAQFIGKFS